MEKIKTYRSSSSDPTWNLALEEYLLLNCRTGRIFLIWLNNPTVVIGKNQDAASEVNLKTLSENEVTLVRRTTGGGAVYHDMGNLNYSFIDDYEPVFPDSSLISDSSVHSEDTHRIFLDPVVDAIRSMGANASARHNDIMIDGRKVGGTAERIYKSRILHHGCLLFNTDIDRLTGLLNPDKEKLVSKGIRSVRERVANIKDYLPEGFDMKRFRENFTEYLCAGYEKEPIDFSFDDLRGIMKLQKKYESDEWNLTCPV